EFLAALNEHLGKILHGRIAIRGPGLVVELLKLNWRIAASRPDQVLEGGQSIARLLFRIPNPIEEPQHQRRRRHRDASRRRRTAVVASGRHHVDRGLLRRRVIAVQIAVLVGHVSMQSSVPETLPAASEVWTFFLSIAVSAVMTRASRSFVVFPACTVAGNTVMPGPRSRVTQDVPEPVNRMSPDGGITSRKCHTHV